MNGSTVAGAAPVGAGNPTLTTNLPISYAQNAQFADVAIKTGTGSYQITLVYTLTFAP